MSDRPESTSSATPSRRHLNRGEIDHLLDGLAVGAGRNRETLDAELKVLRTADISGDEHLTFSEAAAFHAIDPVRQSHADDCRYCKSMLETVYVNDVTLNDFERKLRTQIESTPPMRPRSNFAAWSLAAISLMTAALFGSAYAHQSSEFAAVRKQHYAESALVRTQAAEIEKLRNLPATSWSAPFMATAGLPLHGELLETMVVPDKPAQSSTSRPDHAQRTAAPAVSENLRVLEVLNRRLNDQIVDELKASPEESAAVSPIKAQRLHEAAVHVDYATRLINGTAATRMAFNPSSSVGDEP